MIVGKVARGVVRRLRPESPAPLKDRFPIDAWTDPNYQEWFERHKASAETLNAQRAHRFDSAPTFSIVVPLFETPLDYLRAVVGSVQAQTYQGYELVLVNASPENDELRREVEKLTREDDKIVHVVLDGNYGITENTNRGIEAASGDFLSFLDHDDFLEPDTLFEFASALERDPLIDVLYCDEDLVTVDDKGCHNMHPFFKPDYSPEYLLCKNYVIHLMTIRREIVEDITDRTAVFDGAQDYNMILNAVERARVVHHVPRVLYHWRMSEKSTAANTSAKPYGRVASRLGAKRHLERMGEHPAIFPTKIVNLHSLWFAPDAEDLVTAIIAGDDDAQKTAITLTYLAQTNSYPNLEVIVVAPQELADADLIDGEEHAFIACAQTAGVAEKFNVGAAAAHGAYLLFLQAGNFFMTPEPVEQLLGMCGRVGVGVVGPKLLYWDGEVRSFGVACTGERIMPLYRGYPNDFPAYQCTLESFQNVSAVEFDGMMVTRELFEEAGGFDPGFAGPIGCADFCTSVRQRGRRIVTSPNVRLHTADRCPGERYNATKNCPEFSEADTRRYDEKWPDARKGGDSFVNPNLDQASEYFQVQGSPLVNVESETSE